MVTIAMTLLLTIVGVIILLITNVIFVVIITAFLIMVIISNAPPPKKKKNAYIKAHVTARSIGMASRASGLMIQGLELRALELGDGLESRVRVLATGL